MSRRKKTGDPSSGSPVSVLGQSVKLSTRENSAPVRQILREGFSRLDEIRRREANSRQSWRDQGYRIVYEERDEHWNDEGERIVTAWRWFDSDTGDLLAELTAEEQAAYEADPSTAPKWIHEDGADDLSHWGHFGEAPDVDLPADLVAVLWEAVVEIDSEELRSWVGKP